MSKKVLFELARELISAKKALKVLCNIRNVNYFAYVHDTRKNATLICKNKNLDSESRKAERDAFSDALKSNDEFFECFSIVCNLESKLFDVMNSGISNREYQRVIEFIEASV